ncbi:polycystic kidney disease 2-like 2 protein [Macrosteles quadrilineatus]|uniref:polycystic kidney disease 2-like 2 protein n=1 Tax=Macrosteles quadrilineatus TaxID=74068 RepID=UPI0023E1E437|nr:polycystic kidney disease 2-like 2 protein [Macrosteles quadrilineatus]
MSLSQEIFHETGWLKSGNSRLIGVPRLRQIRVKHDLSNQCKVPEIMQNISRGCHMTLTEETEDRRDYGTGWSNNSLYDVELFDSSPWEYTAPSWGGNYIEGPSGYEYHSGGYVATLHRDLIKTKASLSSLYDTNWFDGNTRALIVDFTLYNVNNDVFTLTTIVTEILTVGSVKVEYFFSSTRFSNFQKPIVLFGLTFLIFFLQFGFSINITGFKRFLSNFWNICDALILMVFVSSTLVYFRWLLIVSDGKDKLSKQGKDVYFSLAEYLNFTGEIRDLIGLLFCLMLFRLLRVVRFNEDIKGYVYDLWASRTEVIFACWATVIFMFVQFRLIMFLITTPQAYSVKDVLIFKSQFKSMVRYTYNQMTGKVLAYTLNFTSQLGIFTFMLSQHHHFKEAQGKTRAKQNERRTRRAEILGHLV